MRHRLQRARAQRGEPGERGAAAVEFALVAPLLLILVFGMITYGYMLSFRQAVSQAAAEGARAAAVSVFPTNAAATANAVAAVNDALGSYGVTCQVPTGSTTGSLLRRGASVGTCAATPAACVNSTASNCMSVAISYDYRRHPLLPTLPGLGLVTPDRLSYTAVARIS